METIMEDFLHINWSLESAPQMPSQHTTEARDSLGDVFMLVCTEHFPYTFPSSSFIHEMIVKLKQERMDAVLVTI